MSYNNLSEMKRIVLLLLSTLLLLSCNKDNYEPIVYDNPEISLSIPSGFPELNSSFYTNKPTKYGVMLGEKLFFDKRLSANNTVSCGSCHNRSSAFADNNIQAIGITGRVGLRNVPPIQNLADRKSVV